jgi:hypothetical protein
MTPKYIASRLWLVGWFVAWGTVIKGPTVRPHGFASQLFFVFGASGLVAGLYLFFRGFQSLQRKRWIEDTPATKISAAALGLVKIVGKAAGPYTLISPLAGVDCYYYQAVARNGTSGQDGEPQQERAVESIHTPIFVADDTGLLMIDPQGAELALPAEYDETISGESTSEGARRFLRRHGLSTAGATTLTEYAIKPGDPLLVLATLRSNDALPPDSAANARCISPNAADLQRREQMEAMGVPPDEIPRQPQPVAPGFDLNPRAILGGGDDGQPFVLSRDTPQRMIDDLARSSVFSIWGGPALALFSLALVLRWLGVW